MFNNELQILIVFFFELQKNENVIKINNTKIVNQATQSTINVDLKNCQCINQVKKQDKIFKIFITSSKSSLSFIFFTNSDSMINISEINFQEYIKAV